MCLSHALDTRTYTHAYSDTYIHTQAPDIDTHTHTHTHTHMHRHLTQTLPPSLRQSNLL